MLWNYENKSGMDSLYIAWRKCVRRIFNIPCNTHCKLVPLICKDSAIHTKLYNCFLRFFINAKKSKNSILSTMTKHVLFGSSSIACKTLNFIRYTYNIQNKYTIAESCIPKLKDDEDEGDVRTPEAILDFIELRSQAVDDANINHVIEYLCTSWLVYLGRWWDFFSFFPLLFVLCFYVLICYTCPLHVFCVLHVSMQNGDCE